MKYNHKSNNLIQSSVFDNTYTLLDDIIDEYKKLRRYEFISLYSNAKQILKIVEWINITGGSLGELEVDLQEYNRDHLLIITIGYDGIVSIEDMYGENGCKFSEAALTYVHDTVCKSNVIITHDKKEENVLCFHLEEDLLKGMQFYNCRFD